MRIRQPGSKTSLGALVATKADEEQNQDKPSHVSNIHFNLRLRTQTLPYRFPIFSFKPPIAFRTSAESEALGSILR